MAGDFSRLNRSLLIRHNVHTRRGWGIPSYPRQPVCDAEIYKSWPKLTFNLQRPLLRNVNTVICLQTFAVFVPADEGTGRADAFARQQGDGFQWQCLICGSVHDYRRRVLVHHPNRKLGSPHVRADHIHRAAHHHRIWQISRRILPAAKG